MLGVSGFRQHSSLGETLPHCQCVWLSSQRAASTASILSVPAVRSALTPWFRRYRGICNVSSTNFSGMLFGQQCLLQVVPNASKFLVYRWHSSWFPVLLYISAFSQFYILRVGPLPLPFQCLIWKSNTINNRNEWMGGGGQQKSISNAKCDQVTQCNFLGQRWVGEEGMPFWGLKRR